jgi:hypothetical protein
MTPLGKLAGKFLFGMLLFGLAGILAAQDISGTIDGTILDPTGAPVPNAKVTVTNTDRNQVVRTITTDPTGTYTAPFIPIGRYNVKVEASGFRTVNRADIVLNVHDDLKINIALEVGQVTETVEVRETTTPVELGTTASSTTITGTQVRELSLATRNYEQLVALMPGVTSVSRDELFIGVSAPANTAATLPFSMNGNRNSANNWTVDGADNVDRGSNLTLLTFPSIDAIEEFKVERSLYTADAGRAGGGQISVATRSGTTQFHGTAYEFNRNDAYAANNWINNANKVNVVNGVAKVPPLRWNDFGYTIGGPVYIPNHYNKDKNKTFFFFSEEFRRIITYNTFQPTLPTTGMLQGNFPVPVCVSYTTSCQQTATQIAPAQFNANSAAYIKDIYSKLGVPAGSITGGFYPERNVYNSRQELARIDHAFTDRFSIWGRFLNDSIPTVEPGGLFQNSSIPNGATTDTNAPGRSIVVHALNTIRPTVLNEYGFNFSRGAILSTPQGLTNKSNNPDINPVLPFANMQGVVPTLAFTGGTSVLGYGPYTEYNRNYAFFDNLTWIRGRHTLKFGFTSNRYQKTENAASGQGSFTFSNLGNPGGAATSFYQSWANFLLGNVATFTQPSTDITPNLWAWQHEAYAQDDFKLTPHLTLYAGVRWSFFGQPNDSNNLLTNFDPTRYNRANAPQINPANGNLVPGTGTNILSNGITVGGKGSPYGDAISNSSYKDFAPRVGIAWDPFGTGITSIRAGYGIYYDSPLFGVYEQNTFANPPYVQSVTYSNASFSNVSGGTLGVSAAPLGLHATPVPFRTPYVQQWSLDIQRQLPHDVVLDVGYYGSKGTHLFGIVDINEAYPGAALAAGLHAPNGNTIFTTADDPNINAARPYLGWNYINALESAFDSNYHSLQTSVSKQFRSAGQISGAYTYSKNLTDNASDRSNAPQNSYNWHEGEYGPATLDRTHVFTFNYVYTLPIFRNGRGAAAYLLKGWEVSGITSYYTGSPFSVVTSSVDPAGLGILGSSSASSRPDMICNPNAGAPHTVAQWFNTACFAPVPQGTVRPGNAGRGVVRGPGFGNWDVSLKKSFAIGERVNLQLRGESFNFLNHPNPDAFTPATPNNTNALFGQITAFRAPRRIQIGAKLTF